MKTEKKTGKPDVNSSALIIVDMQNDFCPGGSLAVTDGDSLVPGINSVLDLHKTGSLYNVTANSFRSVVLTADWHPPKHVSFASFHGKKPFEMVTVVGVEQTLWPDHCVSGSHGSAFHPALKTDAADIIIRKGTKAGLDSYSAFFENDRTTPTGLTGLLKTLDIRTVFLCGLAFDVCVYFSAKDANALGFETFVIEDFSAAVDVPEGTALLRKEEMESSGIRMINSSFLTSPGE